VRDVLKTSAVVLRGPRRFPCGRVFTATQQRIPTNDPKPSLLRAFPVTFPLAKPPATIHCATVRANGPVDAGSAVHRPPLYHPELLTPRSPLRSRCSLRRLVILDRRSWSRPGILDFARREATKMRSSRTWASKPSCKQDEINARMVLAWARAGKRVRNGSRAAEPPKCSSGPPPATGENRAACPRYGVPASRFYGSLPGIIPPQTVAGEPSRRVRHLTMLTAILATGARPIFFTAPPAATAACRPISDLRARASRIPATNDVDSYMPETPLGRSLPKTAMAHGPVPPTPPAVGFGAERHGGPSQQAGLPLEGGRTSAARLGPTVPRRATGCC